VNAPLTKLATTTRELALDASDNARLANLVGALDENLRQVEARLNVEIRRRGAQLKIIGAEACIDQAVLVLRNLDQLSNQEALTPDRVHLCIQDVSGDGTATSHDPAELQTDPVIHTLRGGVRGRGVNQRHYLANIRSHDLTFGIGPAGTGKTYLAVACAVDALQSDRVRRIVLVRPAVEAGERLGFLPGDLTQKVDPYLRPMYDALYDMMGFERVGKAIERNVIEVAPLAFMRGRSLNDSFIILDEAQNTTVEQMKMFLTRIGFGSKAVVTGDITQTDLPRHITSGLRHVMDILPGVEGIAFTNFLSRDVVRHPLVQRIVQAYERRQQEIDERGMNNDG
jgi:phosphate starvation-inducible protein PhoH and related proteins